MNDQEQGKKPVLVVATTNHGKVREVRSVLADLPIVLKTLCDFPGILLAQESAGTFEGNARLKADHYARLTGMRVLADDSGLEVDALGGAPGIHSARFAGPEASDRVNNAKLISALRDVAPERRTARFYCVMALADRNGVVATAGGSVSGVIVDDPRGENGFGYDPHFFLPEFGMTAAQMPADQKNRISHRGRALRAILPAIRQLLQD